jgi:hypothetical protein
MQTKQVFEDPKLFGRSLFDRLLLTEGSQDLRGGPVGETFGRQITPLKLRLLLASFINVGGDLFR